ncbi:MAG: indole-3-glycerol phosphate synthase TrpC [Betaproteobacteria bacterium]|nr:indole-3-glycerol phosphate synthase TrpC [Betaproteobacteria bacterium]
MGTILDRILATKRSEVARAKVERPWASVLAEARHMPPPRDFVGALQAKIASGAPAVIAEIKRASPSAGEFRKSGQAEFDPAAFARSYERHGAACLSVLTDREYFRGSLDDMVIARAACALPVLRKDFIVDAYQIAEARAAGADAVLFIMGTAETAQFLEWEALARELGLAVLAESHTREDLEQALQLTTPLIGINNRDLGTFSTDVNRTLELQARVPDGRMLITESGIDTPDIARRMQRHGVRAFLVGGAFMSQADPGQALQRHFAL